MTKAYEAILVDVEEHVATITLNRPDTRNAWGWQMDHDFCEATRVLDADDEVRAIVVTGAGKAFCGGADFASDQEPFSDEWIEARSPEEGWGIRWGFWRLRTPIIAAINGAAIGAGLTIPMLWDVRFAAEDALMGFSFTRLGIISDANEHWLLPRLIGVSRALELLMSGRLFTGREAAEMGLVSKAFPADEVLPAARDFAREVATKTAPLAVAVTKRLVYQGLQEGDRDGAFGREWAALTWLMRRPDCREGVAAMMGRRAPVWKDSKTADLPADLNPSE